MGVSVSFDYGKWLARYPEFGPTSKQPVDATLAAAYFAEVTATYHRNDGGGPVSNAASQSVLLDMLVAHVAWLYQTNVAGNPVSPLTGRISNATEGSVSVATDALSGAVGTQQWLAQTKYGLSYWYAAAPYRQARYVAGPRRYFGPVYPGRGF